MAKKQGQAPKPGVAFNRPEPEAETVVEETSAPKEESKQAKPRADVEHLALPLIPLGELQGGYELAQAEAGRINLGKGVRSHLNVQLERDNAEKFLRVRQGLRDENAKLDNGRPVYSSADTLRWMLENMEPA